MFDGIEFYLPQLAHMIIHLEVEWDDAILERFALVIAQQSLHFALQLNWILQGALEDYKPELDDGSPNETYSPMFYSRCLKLLKNVERCIVYGKPRAQDFQRLYEQGKITKEELKILELSDRRFNALQITDEDGPVEVGALDGTLFIKLPPTEKNKGTDFVSRFCVLEKNILNVYQTKGCSGELELDRAMSLAKAEVTSLDTNTIRVTKPIYKFELKCGTPEEAKLWTRRLREETDEATLFQSSAVKQDLTPEQLERYNFFENERKFVADLTQIAEDLREQDREHRKAEAPILMQKLNIPPMVYLPLCNSSDIWRRVSSVLHKDTRVFNTKERCPVVMHFISKRGEKAKGVKTDPNLDVAEYMHAYLEATEEIEPVEEGDETKEEEESEAGENGHDKENGEQAEGVEVEEDFDDKASDADMRASSHGSIANVWQEDERGDEQEKKGGTRVQQLLRESVVSVPSRISKRLSISRRGSQRISIMDRQTQLQPLVPILEGSRGPQAADELDNASVGDGTVVSVERSSVMVKDYLVLGSLDEGNIDVESITRASQYVCGGVLWAEKSASMLEEAKKEKNISSETEVVQMEVISCLAKSNDDLRQEVFIMQMIHYYKSVFAQAKLPLWLKTYRILSTSSSTGLIELLTDATSLDGLKKSENYPLEGGLRKYFEKVYGGPNTKAFKAAQTNFMQSLAGYALVAYLLGLKDRHNGNIMIDTRGHLVFIDFGFALGMAPGHEFSFERAPFKLTKEYVEVMGGVQSECFKEFERLFVAGFEEARKSFQIALGLVEIMMFKSNYPCFSGWRYGNGKALTRFEKRLMLDVPDKQVKRKALNLIRRSKQHFGTYLYDTFQKATNGYAM